MSPANEARLRGFEKSYPGDGDKVSKRLQTSVHEEKLEDNNMMQPDPWRHKGSGEPPQLADLLRGGGSKGMKKKAAAKANAAAAAKPKQRGQEDTPTRPAMVKPAPNGPSPEEGELIQEHWNVPIRKPEDMQRGDDGVCIATKDTYLAKMGVLKGAQEGPLC